MSKRSLVSSSLWNLAGGIVPVFFAFFILPLLIERVGLERFGLLTLAWVVVGYFSIFDLGLGRALTKLVAERLNQPDQSSLSGLMWTTQAMISVVGLLGTILILVGSHSILVTALNVPEVLKPETLEAFYLLAYVIPFVTMSAGFRGFLEAYGRFDLVNAVRIPLGIFMFAGPFFAASYDPAVDAMVLTLVVARLVSCLAYFLLCLKIEPAIRTSPRLVRKEIGPLLSFGSWMTVSNLVGPIMLYLDRFLIGALVSVTALAYYSTPYEMITKLLIVPGSFAIALFPAFVQTIRDQSEAASSLYRLGIATVFVVLWVPILTIFMFSFELLFFWLGEEFALNSFGIVRWLAVGVFLNSIAFIPFHFVQAAGRPDIAARIHLIELPFYLAALYYSVKMFGAEGAAMTWAFRVAIDALIFAYMAAWLHAPLRVDLRNVYVGFLLGLIGFVLAYWPSWFVWKVVVLVASSIAMLAFVWKRLLSGLDRQVVLSHDVMRALHR